MFKCDGWDKFIAAAGICSSSSSKSAPWTRRRHDLLPLDPTTLETQSRTNVRKFGNRRTVPKAQNGDEMVEPQSSRTESIDTRSPTAKAMDWVSRITTISVMMVLPALGGYYLDQQFGTVAVFLFLGMILGIAAAGWQLYKLVQHREKQFEQEQAARNRRNQGQGSAFKASDRR